MEALIPIAAVVCVIAFIVTIFRRARRSPDADRRGKSGIPYRADPLAHLDIKRGSVSITEAPAPYRAPPRDGDYAFEIEYLDRNGNRTMRKITWPGFSRDGKDTIIEAYCSLREEVRTFRGSRIVSCRNLQTGRQIKDLGEWLRRFR